MKNAESFLIVNANVITLNEIRPKVYIYVQNEKIKEIGEMAQAPTAVKKIDAKGAFLLPGFVDVHVHGGANHDFMEATRKSLQEITKFHASHGTTSMLATTLTAPQVELTKVIQAVATFMKHQMPYAKLQGVHLEGPFVSEKWKGAQNPDYILPPQVAWLKEWTAKFPGMIKIQTLAPESEGALSYIEQLVLHGIVPSCGHTDATYEEVISAADHGLKQATHTFNAMSPLHHRHPGTVGAVLSEDRIMAEVIADGHHMHPATVKLLLRCKTADRVILITDAMAAAGMPDGDYELGGLPVKMQDGIACLKHGNSLAGSTLTMLKAYQFLVKKLGVSLPVASLMASLNPARQIGLEKELGSIATGKKADFLLLDDSLSLLSTWINGRQVY